MNGAEHRCTPEWPLVSGIGKAALNNFRQVMRTDGALKWV